SREGEDRQGAVRDTLRGLPQRLALRVDGAEQVWQALRARGTDPAIRDRHGSATVPSSAPLRITGQLSSYLPGDLRGKELVATGDLYYGISSLVTQTALSKLTLSPADEAKIHGYREYPLPPAPIGVYKAAPRDGVWATPPFLHNGSVPNIYEMLVPAAERTKKFYITREFDPVKVGLDTTATSGFLFDTTLLGNSNAGHSFQDGPRGNGTFGPLLSDDQRWVLIEYLKSIPEEPGRVT